MLRREDHRTTVKEEAQASTAQRAATPRRPPRAPPAEGCAPFSRKAKDKAGKDLVEAARIALGEAAGEEELLGDDMDVSTPSKKPRLEDEEDDLLP